MPGVVHDADALEPRQAESMSAICLSARHAFDLCHALTRSFAADAPIRLPNIDAPQPRRDAMPPRDMPSPDTISSPRDAPRAAAERHGDAR